MEIVQQFQTTSFELVAVQRDLSQLFRLSADPLLEAQTSARRAELTARRDALLDQWARLGLAWLLQGGGVQLLEAMPTGDAARSTEGGEAGQAAPAAEPTVVTAPAPYISERPAEYTGMNPNFAPSWTRSPPPRPAPVDLDRLREVLKGFDPPPTNIQEESQVRDELRRLADNTTPNALGAWLDFPKEVQRALVGMAVARARYVQDEISPALHPITIDQELDRFFSGMTAFSKREQPGFVFGLRRHHHPVAERWAEDAQRWWGELASRLPEPITPNPERALNALMETIEQGGGEEEVVQRALEVLDAGVAADDPRFVRVMIPHQDKLRKHTRFKRLRKALRDTMTEDEAILAESLAEDATIPADWEYDEDVRESHSVILGGEPNEEARKRAQEAFGFEKLDWVNGGSAQAIQDLVENIKAGDVDMVILLRRYITQSLDRTVIPAARTEGIPWVSVERGFGVQQIRAAIERALATPPEADDEG